MDYISIEQAAKKFRLSEQKMQKLCETNCIQNCVMKNGAWLIPATAQAPVEKSCSPVAVDAEYITLKELCDILSISAATGRNWIKQKKLIPQYTDKKTPYFTREYLKKLQADIQTGENKRLKSRRNKKYVSGNSFYNSYVSANCKNLRILQNLLRLTAEEGIALSLETIQYFVADCALHLFAQKNHSAYKGDSSLLYRYLTHSIKLPVYHSFIDALISNKADAVAFCKAHPLLFDMKYLYEPSEDILGLIYISCKNLGSRKATGAYYTPTKVVARLISHLALTPNDKILDPCCGTGNFLLQLPDTIPFAKINGNDLDSISVKIARINMALKYDALPVAAITSHITQKNYLTEYTEADFQYIIGNPPWGYAFSEEEKENLRNRFITASEKNIESYDIFIERALKNLSPNGYLSFVLPEALLNVKAHSPIRKLLLEKTSVTYVEFLENVFDSVQCPAILLQLQFTGKQLSTVGLKVKTAHKNFDILTERKVTEAYFNFQTTDEEYSVLEKIKSLPHTVFLSGNADFALGIVTGNNRELVSSEKNASNEMVLRGADLCKYHANPSHSFILFKPESFQQVAPAAFYRAPEKLLYRFISRQLVFAYDNKQTLSLNSCNIVIPRLQGIDIKYVLAILNSRVAQFLYQMEFHSVKVLRSHIECIPIPVVDKAMQHAIIQVTDRLISGLSPLQAQEAYEHLDSLICRAFFLTPAEQAVIKKAVDGDNKFLTIE